MVAEGKATTAGGAGQPWHLYRCVVCRSAGLDGTAVVEGEGTAVCQACHLVYPVIHNVVDTLVRPSASVIEELRGLAAERDLPIEQWADVKIRQVDHLPTIEERLEMSVSEPVEYYQQTTESFDQALAMIGVTTGSKVLEVGPHAPFWFLEQLRQLGAECFAINLLYFYADLTDFMTWPHKALGDMNDLPYLDETFDLVLLSATAHHSPALRPLFAEIARVLIPGGRALILNEPVEGLVKRLSGPKGHGRDEHIGEHQYRIWDYTKAMRSAGFEWVSVFPDFFDRKLRAGDLRRGMRHRSVGLLASRLWSYGRFRRLARTRFLWTAQATVGLPLNAVLFKPRDLDPLAQPARGGFACSSESIEGTSDQIAGTAPAQDVASRPRG